MVSIVVGRNMINYVRVDSTLNNTSPMARDSLYMYAMADTMVTDQQPLTLSMCKYSSFHGDQVTNCY